MRRNLAALLSVCGLLVVAPAWGREPTFEDRVAAQRAIEQVYWNHRIWPTENSGPKPPLSAVLPEEAIRARVEGYLEKSNALEQLWEHPITAEQLQAEMDRMARDTRDGATLQELYAALGNDPFVIAETLARQTLADRLFRNGHARGERFHGDSRREAETALAGVSSGAEPWWATQSVDTRGDPARGRREFDLAEVIASGACVPDTWRTVMVVPSRRSLHTAVWTGSEMIVWGGSGEDGELDTGGRYDPATDSWVAMTVHGAPTARWYHTAVWTGSEMIVWGQYDSPSGTGAGGRYNPASDTWLALTITDAPSPRYHQTAVWTGDEMVVWGGTDDSGNALDTGGRYNPSTDSWVATTTSGAPAARWYHTAVWTGSEMIVWGGFRWDDNGANHWFNTGGRYNPATDSWVATTTSAAPAARWYHTAVWTGSEMIVWGGSYWSARNDGGRYNPATDSWAVTTTSGGPAARVGHTAVWTGSEMIVWGGVRYVGTTGQWLNTGGRYDPATDSWEAMTTTDAPAGRDLHTAVWTGSEMIVWGGSLGEFSRARFNTGGRYSPSTDSWLATPTTDAPPARRDYAAVWTGSEMIVWGAYVHASGAEPTNAGGRYNPATDSWASMTTTGAPAARRGHVAVWTGGEMIVWGGSGEAGALDTGGRYNPASDSWVAVTTTDAPTARDSHTAVWTGSEMIVWGGYLYDGTRHVFETGGRYNPSTDSWVATTTLAAPSARDSHTAVWTGSEMIVWGGVHYMAGLFNTGGRYNPSTDSWVATTSTGAPTARWFHTAVWTGSEMIVWGGTDSLNAGGRYDPSSDSWVATTTTDAPTARDDHTAVWTGGEMIVWGGRYHGQGGNQYLDTGGSYSPSSDRWVATTTDGALAARSGHAALWTGSEMIVFGGYPADGYVGLYCASSASQAGATHDLDGDGRPDILWRNADTGATGAWRMNGTTFEAWLALPTEPPSSGWRIEGLGNVDNAGGADVLWRNTTTGETGAWLTDGGNVIGWAWLPTEPPDTGWQIQGVGDFDGNGVSDVLWRNENTGQIGAWLLDATLNQPVVVGWVWMPTEPPDTGWQIQGVGDFSGDGSPEVLWRNTTTGTVGAWLMDGTLVTDWVWMPTEPPDSGWQIGAVVDLTGDGVSEVVWRNAITGQTGAWLMEGTAVTGWVWMPTEPPSSGWEIEGP